MHCTHVVMMRKPEQFEGNKKFRILAEDKN